MIAIMNVMTHSMIANMAPHTPVITPDFDAFVGRSAVMQTLYAMITSAAAMPANVLISGETGTGKDLTARSLHAHSARAHKPFISLNCAALTRELVDSELFGHRRGAFTGATQDYAGVLARAEGGTLFLDEITELPAHLQAKLLHVVESGHYRRLGDGREYRADVRIIAATNRNLDDARAQGVLRDDLYHRLCALHLHLPPLRLRGDDDIIRLALYLLQAISNQPPRLDDSAKHFLAAQPWQGNVREIANTLRHAVAFAPHQGVLTASHFQSQLLPVMTAPATMTTATLDALERVAVEQAINLHQGNLSAAARSLGIDVSTLHRKRKRWQHG